MSTRFLICGTAVLAAATVIAGCSSPGTSTNDAVGGGGSGGGSPGTGGGGGSTGGSAAGAGGSGTAGSIAGGAGTGTAGGGSGGGGGPAGGGGNNVAGRGGGSGGGGGATGGGGGATAGAGGRGGSGTGGLAGATGGGGAAGRGGSGGTGGAAGGGGGGGQAGLNGFVTRQGLQFMEGGRRHTFAGANFWQGMNLGAEGTGGDRARLVRELDRLRALGVTNVRVVAASEGPDTAPYRTVPALLTSPGVYNEQVFRGLDVFLDELARRGIRAVMVLNNYWEWTGGFGQYVRWSDNSQIPDRIANSSLYSAFIQYVNRFYGCASCQTNYRAHINTVVNRVNTVNGRRYRDDPVVFSWQLANEPRDYPSNWVGDTAQYIKSLDPNHMVSVGSEGTWASNTTGTAATNFFLTTHQSQYIDYATCHIWVEPWGMYNASDSSAAMLTTATNFATGYLRDHDTLAKQLGKPLVLEEFGLARDGWAAGGKYDPASPATNRDKYYRALFTVVETSLAATGGALAGDNFWAWGGEARPPSKWTGDPPHEPPGWFSVYDADSSTTAIVSAHATAVRR